MSDKNKSNKNSWFKSHMYLLGFTGFLGLFYFKLHDTTVLGFLVFFSFFAWKWLMKYEDVEKDAIFIANRNKAAIIALFTFVAVINISIAAPEHFPFDTLSVEIKYAMVVAGNSLGTAIGFIVYGYLLDKYEKESRNVSLNNETSNEINKDQINSNV